MPACPRTLQQERFAIRTTDTSKGELPDCGPEFHHLESDCARHSVCPPPVERQTGASDSSAMENTLAMHGLQYEATMGELPTPSNDTITGDGSGADDMSSTTGGGAGDDDASSTTEEGLEEGEASILEESCVEDGEPVDIYCRTCGWAIVRYNQDPICVPRGNCGTCADGERCEKLPRRVCYKIREYRIARGQGNENEMHALRDTLFSELVPLSQLVEGVAGICNEEVMQLLRAIEAQVRSNIEAHNGQH
ncbi:unnamed protein product [Clonostachys rosea f. rosea IK726]|uniref:Uncharacterized protein n=1 Tax=Clonostachys rosea f. rosea IK726 TaxID=1349383 RepID=A0ACA9TCA2_BIOOC|nr:unnamed protein product [Clonostachys rosea f. rosea IK726]